MSNTILNTECNRDAIVELNDADLHFISAASGYVISGISRALCSQGLIPATKVTIDGRDFFHQCPG
jgi:hypothetical protein